MTELENLPFFNLTYALLTTTPAPPALTIQIEQAIAEWSALSNQHYNWVGSFYVELIKLIRLLVLCDQDKVEHIKMLSSSAISQELLAESINLFELMVKRKRDYKDKRLHKLAKFIFLNINSVKQDNSTELWKNFALVIIKNNDALLLDGLIAIIEKKEILNAATATLCNQIYPHVYTDAQWDALIERQPSFLNQTNKIIQKFQAAEISLKIAEENIYEDITLSQHETSLALYKLLLLAGKNGSKQDLIADVYTLAERREVNSADREKIFIIIEQYSDLFEQSFLMELYAKTWSLDITKDFFIKFDLLHILIKQAYLQSTEAQLIEWMASLISIDNLPQSLLVLMSCRKFYNKNINLGPIVEAIKIVEKLGEDLNPVSTLGKYFDKSSDYFMYFRYLFQNSNNKIYANSLLRIIAMDNHLCSIQPSIAIKIMQLYEVIGESAVSFLQNTFSSSEDMPAHKAIQQFPWLKNETIDIIKSCFSSLLFLANPPAVQKAFLAISLLLELLNEEIVFCNNYRFDGANPLQYSNDEILIKFLNEFQVCIMQPRMDEIFSYLYTAIFCIYLDRVGLDTGCLTDENLNSESLFEWIIPILKDIYLDKISMRKMQEFFPSKLNLREIVLNYIQYAAADSGNNFEKSYKRASRQLGLSPEEAQKAFYKFNANNFQAILQLSILLQDKFFDFLRSFLNTSSRPLERFFSAYQKPLPKEYLNVLIGLSKKIITKKDYASLEQLFYIIISLPLLAKELISAKNLEMNVLLSDLGNIINKEIYISGILKECRNLAKKYYFMLLGLQDSDVDDEVLFNNEYFPSIITARSSESLQKYPNHKALLDDIIKEVFLGNMVLEDYVLNLEQKSTMGKKLAKHNQNIIQVLQENGVNTEVAFAYSHTHEFSYIGNATIDLNQNLFAIWSDICNVEKAIELLQNNFQNHKEFLLLSKKISAIIVNFKKQIVKISGKQAVTAGDVAALRNIATEPMQNLLEKIFKNVNVINTRAEKCELNHLIPAEFVEHTKHLKDRVSTFKSYRQQKKIPVALKTASQYSVKLCKKGDIHTLKLGEALGCCLSPNGGRFQAMIERIFDMAMFMPVVIEVSSGQPVCGAWAFFSEISVDDEVSIGVVFNFIEMAAGKSHVEDLRNLLLYQLFSYTLQYMEAINIKYLLAAPLTYGNIPPLLIEQISNVSLYKVGGFFKLGNSDYYLKSLNFHTFHLCTKANIDAAFPNQVTKPPHQQVDVKALQAYSFINNSASNPEQAQASAASNEQSSSSHIWTPS
jgi:hypothetical protein